MKIFRLNYMIICLLCCTGLMAQTKKLDKSYKTNSGVTVNIDSKYTNVIIDYWDKNEVQIEALLEMKGAEKKDIEKNLDAWKLETRGNAAEVYINSAGGGTWDGNIDMTALEGPMASLTEIISPLQEMIGPLLEGISGNPLPQEFYDNMAEMKFDYEAYRKDGDKYLEKWEKKMEKGFGKDFERSMEEWAERFEKDSAMWKRNAKETAELEKRMEAWGEEFGKSMEAWGENFGKEMEKWGEQVGKEMESRYGDKKVVVLKNSDAAKKTIKIRMPRNGQVKMNIRHGDVKLNGETKNLRGDISHSKFSANTISGEKTDLKVSYTPVKVRQWNYGMLNASYVQDLNIDKAVSIKLTSNSSEVTVKELENNGIFKGTFGELVIEKLGTGFNSLDIILENSDLKLDLPDVAYNFTYTGTKSKLTYPEELKVKSSKSYDTQKLQGFSKNKNANASVSISASFSDVLLK